MEGSKPNRARGGQDARLEDVFTSASFGHPLPDVTVSAVPPPRHYAFPVVSNPRSRLVSSLGIVAAALSLVTSLTIGAAPTAQILTSAQPPTTTTAPPATRHAVTPNPSVGGTGNDGVNVVGPLAQAAGDTQSPVVALGGASSSSSSAPTATLTDLVSSTAPAASTPSAATPAAATATVVTPTPTTATVATVTVVTTPPPTTTTPTPTKPTASTPPVTTKTPPTAPSPSATSGNTGSGSGQGSGGGDSRGGGTSYGAESGGTTPGGGRGAGWGAWGPGPPSGAADGGHPAQPCA